MLITTIIPLQIIAEYNTLRTNPKIVTITITFNEEDFKFDTIKGYDTVHLNNGGIINEIGKPMLPLKNIMVAVPEGIKATSIKILNIIEKELPSKYTILPVQPPLRIGQSIKEPVSILKDINIYQLKKTYPSIYINLGGQTDLAGQAIAMVTIFPLQYNPALKTLKLLKEIKFEIEGEKGYVCGDYLPAYILENKIEKCQQKIMDMVVNPYDVVLHTQQDYQPIGVDPGDYDYVIITKNAWKSAFQPLSDWKTQKGIPANIVTTEWINSNYSGSSNKAKIRAFIQDAHSNWGTTFFLLGGDTDTIPYHNVTYKGDIIPTDTYYSDYDDDWTCEVHVGRASVTGVGTGVGKIGNFINKTLTYEKDPPITSYAKNIALFGFDLDWTTEGEDCKIDIDNLYIPSDWNVTKVYDSHSGNHEDNVDAATNSGQNLINHIDHSGEYYMGTGHTNHNWGLNTSEVDAFSNGNKQSTWYSIGCWAAAFDYDNCIAEHFVRDKNGGGVGFVGNTRYGWYYVGGDDLASLRYDRYFFRSFFNQNHYKLGDLFSDHKMDAYFSMTQNDLNKYIFSELNLLGDPELPIWMDNPASFVVSHPSEIPVGGSSFIVHVEDSGGSNIEDAYVCLWKDGEVYLKDYTDSIGNVTFNPSPSTEGIMKVTVTKQDYVPYEDNVNVIIINDPPNIPNTPNPPDEATGVGVNSVLSWNCSDPNGDSLTYDVYFGTVSPPLLVSNNQTSNSYNPGTMNPNTKYYWQIVAWDNHGASTSGPIWDYTTENNPPYIPSNPDPSDGETDVDINADLSWTSGDPDGDPVTYDVYFGTVSPPPQVFLNQTDSIYDPGTMIYETMYYWKIVSWDNNNDSSIGPIWSFITEPDPTVTVCISLYTGWNLITIPVENNLWASTLAENITNSQMISWFDCTNQTYETYIVGGPPGFDFPIIDGVGHFVLVDESSYLNITGTPLENVSWSLCTGWNMIGWYNPNDIWASNLAENISDCSMVSWFNPDDQMFESYIVGGPPGFDFTITQGMGVFVLIDSYKSIDSENMFPGLPEIENTNVNKNIKIKQIIWR